MVRKMLAAVAAMAAAAAVTAAPSFAQTAPSAEEGEQLFGARCKNCHEPAVDRAPTRGDLATRTQAQIVASMTSGVMTPMAAGLTPAQIQSLALYLAPQAPPAGGGGGRGRPVAVATEDKMCATNPPIQAGKNDWPMAGYDIENSRYQPNPGIKLADVPKLKVKWAFSI
ncbi:MAG: cytochrome c, partial [Alphaproteobacteria bacterium]